MADSSSAHVDTFCRAHLPPESEWPEFLLDRPEVTYPDRLNCATALLDDTIDELGADRPCLLAPAGKSWSYGELLSTSNRIAHLLTTELGLVPGNRVLLRGPNNPWLVACWFGVLKAGGVVVATMPHAAGARAGRHPRDRPDRPRAVRPPVPRRPGRGDPRRTDDRLRRRRRRTT